MEKSFSHSTISSLITFKKKYHFQNTIFYQKYLTRNKIMIIAIIQARVGSTRLPNKVLKNLGDKTVLEQVVSRVRKSKYIDDVFVATTINENNLPIIQLCSKKKIRVFCGSEEDVLDRYYQLAKLIKPTHIVRITADCPVIDFNIIDLIIKNHLNSKSDYTSNTIVDSYPDGLDTEIFSYSALEKAWNNANLISEREHVTPYIKKHPNLFNIKSIVSRVNYNDKRWTLDTHKDYEFLKEIFKLLYSNNNYFGMNEILDLLRNRTDLETINSNIIRNEGYLQSIENDKFTM